MSDKEEEKSERKEDMLVPLNLSNIYVMICPKCGSLYPEKYNFVQGRNVSRIRKALPEKQAAAINKGFEKKEKESWENEAERYCETCGKTYSDGEEVCPECGIMLVELKCDCGTAYIKKESGEYNKYCPTYGQIIPFGKISTNVGQATVPQSVVHQYNVGDKITFGNYPFYEDGREKTIDWIILDIDANGNALLISDYALDNVSYNKEFVEITWEESTIKQWLNETFINKAFTPEQRSKIIKSRIANKDNAEYKTRGGEDIYDKLFLLSIEEVMKYFKDDESRIAYPTPYAKSSNSVNGYLYQSTSHVRKDRGGSCWWWLRSPGYHQNNVADIGSVGKLNSKGVDVNSVNGAVRPAFRINLNNL